MSTLSQFSTGKQFRNFRRRYVQAGSYTFVAPPGVMQVYVVVIGAGGGNGVANWDPGSSDGRVSSTGGGGGGYAEGIANVTPGASIAVTVGAGGAGVTRSRSFLGVAGGTGGTSSFGSFISATGGTGGTGAAASVGTIAPGGTGGAGSNGGTSNYFSTTGGAGGGVTVYATAGGGSSGTPWRNGTSASLVSGSTSSPASGSSANWQITFFGDWWFPEEIRGEGRNVYQTQNSGGVAVTNNVGDGDAGSGTPGVGGGGGSGIDGAVFIYW